MNGRVVLWLWLHEVLGPCNAKFKPLIEEYEYIERIYEHRETAAMAARLTPAEYRRARELTREDVREVLHRCENTGIRVLCYSDEDYPVRLRNTHYPPAVLFVTGDIASLDRPFAVAGVGARFSTRYGREAVQHICGPLAKAQITLVSGLAYGIDAEVHRAALDSGGPTVAVLGTAIDNTYPAKHQPLRDEIERSGGAIVSEYPPGTKTQPHHFAQRNRIISGLARAVVIFEAAKKSGTMITANWALDDGREVFAVPGSIFSTHSEGTNYLIRQGAIPATCAGDIVDMLDWRGSGFEQLSMEMPKPERDLASTLTGEQQKIYKALSAGALTLDELGQKTGFGPHILLSQLMEMEMDGIAESLGGSRYALKT